jgi:pilus assembly protein Flp/PilA
VKERFSAYFPAREDGQGMVEYALILVLVAIVAIAGLLILGPKLASFFTAIGTSV